MAVAGARRLAAISRETTVAEWAGAADAVCAPALVEQRRLGERLQRQVRRDAGGRLRALGRGAAPASGPHAATLDGVEALARPGALTEGEIQSWLAAARRCATLTERLADAYEAQDDARIAQLTGQADRRAEASPPRRAPSRRACAQRVQE